MLASFANEDFETSTYAAIRNRARQALDRAEIKKAKKLFEWALVEAKRCNDTWLEERAHCNLIMSATADGSASRYVAGTTAILAQSRDPETRFLAAYNLAQAFDGQGAQKQARFYAHIACRQAKVLDDPLPDNVATYLLGKLQLGESRLQSAQRSLEAAIELLDGRHDPRNLALQSSTLGYCLTLLGQSDRALDLLETSVETITRTECRLYEPAVWLNFGFASFEMEDFENAAHQADRALSASPGSFYRKHALYLSADALCTLGQFDVARERFRLLQQEFYPQMPTLADELLATRIQGVISWLA